MDPVKQYKRVLYVSQFVIDADALTSLSDMLQKVLTRLKIQIKGEKWDKFQEVLSIVIDDLKKIENERDPKTRQVAKTTRKLTNSFAVFYALLLAIASLINAINTRSIKPTGIQLKSFFRVSASASLLLSAVPLADHYLSSVLPLKLHPYHKRLAVLLTSAGSLALYPKVYNRDLISFYIAFYALEGMFNQLNRKNEFQKFKIQNKLVNKLATGSWILIPISLSELYYAYLNSPGSLYGSTVSTFDFLFRGLWSNTTKIVETFEAVTVYKSGYGNAFDSNITSTIVYRPNLARGQTFQGVLFRSLPNIYIKILILVSPIVIIKELIQSEKPITLENFKLRFIKIMKKSLNSSVKLSTVTFLSTLSAYLLTVSNVKIPGHLIGFLSGLWAIAYKNTAKSGISIYLLRLAALSYWRRLSSVNPILNSSLLNTVAGAFAITTLVDLQAKSLKEPSLAMKLAKKIALGDFKAR